MKSFKVFETVVQIVQEVLNENPAVVIHRGYKITNRAGRKREIDVFIESSDPDFPTVAIECKDWKKKVPAEVIEAFHSKCLRIDGINKKIVVSRNGFQKDAFNAAEEFGIELHLLEQITLNQVNTWYRRDLIQPGTFERFVSGASIKFQEPRPSVTPSLSDTLFLKGFPDGIPVGDFIKGWMKANNPTRKNSFIQEIKPNSPETTTIAILCEDAKIQIQKNLYQISEIIVTICESYQIGKSDISVRRYSNEGGRAEGIQAVTIIPEADEKSLISITKSPDESHFRLHFPRNHPNFGLFRFADIRIEKKSASDN